MKHNSTSCSDVDPGSACLRAARLAGLTLTLSLAACAGSQADAPVRAPEPSQDMPLLRQQAGAPRFTSTLASPGSGDVVELRQVTGIAYEPRHVSGPMGQAVVGHEVERGRRVCTLPCSAVVDGRERFFFGGPGLA